EARECFRRQPHPGAQGRLHRPRCGIKTRAAPLAAEERNETVLSCPGHVAEPCAATPSVACISSIRARLLLVRGHCPPNPTPCSVKCSALRDSTRCASTGR